VQMLQQADKITVLYSDPDHAFRQVRLNQSHSQRVMPSWYGDSVGHYEGSTLVIDTEGQGRTLFYGRYLRHAFYDGSTRRGTLSAC
jgi:hypothetical protein